MTITAVIDQLFLSLWHFFSCKCRLRWCHTVFGANILSWPRLIQEDKRFSQLGPVACGLAAEHYDGVLAHHLVDSNWTVHHVTDKCLYDHSPSPQVSCKNSTGPCLDLLLAVKDASSNMQQFSPYLDWMSTWSCRTCDLFICVACMHVNWLCKPSPGA